MIAAKRKRKAPKMLWGYTDSDGNFRPRTRISDSTVFYKPENIKIADNVFIGHYTVIDGTVALDISEGVQIAAMAGVFTHSSHISIRLYGPHYQEIPEADKKGYQTSPVKIGKYAYIGAGARILPGVTIGKGAVIASGAIVSKNVDDFQIVSGNPAKVTGDARIADQRYLTDPQINEWYHEWQKT